MGEAAAVEQWPEIAPIRSPRTLVRVLFFLLAIAGAWVLLLVAFPPGAPDRLPVLVIGLVLGLASAARPERALVVFAFLFPCAGLLARVFSGTDPAAWTSILLASLAAGWCFRFIYDFDSSEEPSDLDPPLRRLLAIWILAAVLAVARAQTLWALLRGLSGRVVNGEGLLETEAVRESVLSLAALAGGAVFFLILRRSGEPLRRRALRSALLGVSVSAVGAGLQKLLLLPGETKPLWRATGRVAGGAADPNSLGLLCALALVVGATRGARLVSRSASIALLVILAGGLMLSGSRSGLLILLVTLPLAALAGGPRLRTSAMVVALVILLGMALLLVRGFPGTVLDRLAQSVDPAVPLEYRVSARPVLWRAAWSLFRENPLEGGGLGAFAWRFPDLMRLQNRTFPTRDNPGSGYVQALAETGALGFLVTVLFSIALASVAIRRIRESSEDPLRGAAGVAVAAFLAALLLGSHWVAPDVALLFFLLVSIVAAPPRPRARAPEAARTAAVFLYAVAVAVAILLTARPQETFRYAPRIGFHGPETGPEGPFRWTRGRFALWVEPGRSLRLDLANQTPLLGSVPVSVRAGGLLLARFQVFPRASISLRLQAPRDRPAAFVFRLGRTFIPRRFGPSDDRRELGLVARER